MNVALSDNRSATGLGEAPMRKAINTVLADLLLPLISNPVERVERGNLACTLILDRISALNRGPLPEGFVHRDDFAREYQDSVNGTEAKAAHADGCGVHDDYWCDCVSSTGACQ